MSLNGVDFRLFNDIFLRLSLLTSAPRRSSSARSASRYPRLVSAGRRRCLFVSGEPAQANVAGLCALRAPGLYIGFGAELSLRYAFRQSFHFGTLSGRVFEQYASGLNFHFGTLFEI